MRFERFFKVFSYLAVFCGFLSLWVTGNFGPVESSLFIVVLVAAWLLDGSRWLLSERIGTVLIVLALPSAYAAFKFGLFSFYGTEAVIAGVLARLILALTAIKLLQKKADRDWIFLYLMSFFEVLLAAGLSISFLYLSTFLLYLLVMACTVIAFEMRKTRRDVGEKIYGEVSDSRENCERIGSKLSFGGFPAIALVLIAFIAALALPLFFLLPRVGGAGFGGMQRSLSTSTGFSDSVRLGGIGRLQQNDAVVMRVKLDGDRVDHGDLYFRGVALDTFDNRTWSRSKLGQKEPFLPDERGVIQVDYASGRDNLLVQTIYLEPLDTPVLFAVPKAIAVVQGNYAVLFKDKYGAISFQPNSERNSYKVLSDTSLPPVSRLRADEQGYSVESLGYLQMPEEHDRRIDELATQVAGNKKSRYDKAVAIETYLRSNFGYTLEMRSSGPEPVADFLFIVKEGHCEYFASAMAVMLRSQGVAARIVNGFHNGEYNEAAGMYVVRQRHAHAWVEVYFPKENVWVPFDPTPASSGDAGSGFMGRAEKYLEALDAIWIQYFVAFDNQGQRSLARTVRDGFVQYQSKTGSYFSRIQEAIGKWWQDARGDSGALASSIAVGSVVAIVIVGLGVLLLVFWIYRGIGRSAFFQRLRDRLWYRRQPSAVEFYDRMQQILSEKGFSRLAHQTPLEFADSTGIREVVQITRLYNLVRFGKRELDEREISEMGGLLEQLRK